MSNEFCFYINSFSTSFLEPGESPSQLNLISASIYQKIIIIIIITIIIIIIIIIITINVIILLGGAAMCII